MHSRLHPLAGAALWLATAPFLPADDAPAFTPAIREVSPGVFKTWLPGYASVQDNALMWIDSNDAVAGKTHPVISQNLYKLSGGRFTQIGQAWLKHGFCALQGTVCSPCSPGGSCPALYPGCSDPYDAGLNGQQSGLGPKSEVNAFTGFFPYPWMNNGSGSRRSRQFSA